MQSANRGDTANHISASVSRIGLADVRQCVGVSEDVEGLLELGKVVWADEDRGRTTVTSHGDALTLTLHPVDDVAEMVADLAERLNPHGNKCGARLSVAPPTSGLGRGGTTLWRRAVPSLAHC